MNRKNNGNQKPIPETINAIRSIGHVFKTALIIVSVMLFCIPVIWAKSFSAPIPVKQNLMASAVGVSKACICSPKHERSSIMDTLVKKGNDAQTTDHDGNGMELKIVNIDSLSIPQHHPRSDFGNLETLQGSIRRDGLQEPLLVYELEAGKFGIIDGARRLKAAQEMGLKQISCLIIKGISEAEAAHLSYVKNIERKTLSPIEIARHIRTMRDEFGYTLNELELKGYGSPASISNKLKLLDLPDKIQRQIQDGTLTAGHGLALTKLPTREEQERKAKKIIDFDLTVTKTDYQIDRYLSKKRKDKKVRPKEIVPSGDVPGVYFKDAGDMGDEMPDKSVHLIVTSPPYNIGMEYEKGITFKEHLVNIQDVLKECARVLVSGGVIALNVSDITDFKGQNGQNDNPQIQLVGHIYQSALKKHGVYLTDEIIWAKRPAWGKNRHIKYKVDTPHASYRIFNNWEHVFLFRKKGEREIPSEEIVLESRLTQEQWIAYVNGVWSIEAVRDNLGHPCMYPDELVNRIVRMFSYVGDTVLDPFMGSGSSVKVARELGRVGIGYERELQYKPVIMKRLGIVPDEALDAESLKTTMENIKQALPSGGPDMDVDVEAVATEEEVAAEAFRSETEIEAEIEQ